MKASQQARRILFSTGLSAVLLYTLHVIIGGFLWKGYNHLQQPISDLTGEGAPNQSLMLVFTTAYGFLALLFAISIAVFEKPKHNKLVGWGSICFVLMHLVSLSYGLFPEDLQGKEQTFAGFMHIAVTALIVPFTIMTPLLLGLGFRKEENWKAFGIYSIITGVLILIFGGMSAMFFINKYPFFGLIERLNIGTLQIWTLLLSLKLITTR